MITSGAETDHAQVRSGEQSLLRVDEGPGVELQLGETEAAITHGRGSRSWRKNLCPQERILQLG